MKTCTLCGRPVVARGWCGIHYGRWQRTGDPSRLRRIPTTNENGEKAICHVAHCERPVRNKGLCGVHYSRLCKWGTTAYVGKKNEGATRHPLYQTWKKVRTTGCVPEWQTFAIFVQAVTDRPYYMARLHRVDVERPFGPNNWRWSEKRSKRPRSGQWKREASRVYALKSKRKLRDAKLRFSYNITVDDYTRLLNAQNRVCAICKEKPEATLAVDHCHETGKIRGLLCRKCNTALGGFRDNKDFLAAAISYLEGSSDEPEPVGMLPSMRVQKKA